MSKKHSSSFFKDRIIDCHTHCGIEWSNFYLGIHPYCQDALSLSNTVDDCAVDFALVFTMPTTIYFDMFRYWREGKYYTTDNCDFPFQLENHVLLQQITTMRLDNLLPFLSFSLRDSVDRQVDYLRQLVKQYPVYGLKYHTAADQCSAQDIAKLGKSFLEVAEEFNLPITIHCNDDDLCNPLHILSLAADYSHLRFCVAHYGKFLKSFFNELESGKYPNVFIDSAPTISLCFRYGDTRNNATLSLDYSNPINVARFFFDNYSDRMLWGTDMPWVYYFRFMSDTVSNRAKRVSYRDEVLLLDEAVRDKKALSSNQIRFLYGKGEVCDTKS